MQRRQWHPTLVLFPGKSHGRRSLVGYSPWGRQESDMTEQLHFHALEKEMANPLQCSCLENPRDGEPGRLLSMGSHRVGHDWSNLAAAAAHMHCTLSGNINCFGAITIKNKSELSVCIWNQADYWDVLLNPNVQTQWFNDTLIIISEGRTQTWMFQGTQVILNV